MRPISPEPYQEPRNAIEQRICAAFAKCSVSILSVATTTSSSSAATRSWSLKALAELRRGRVGTTLDHGFFLAADAGGSGCAGQSVAAAALDDKRLSRRSQRDHARDDEPIAIIGDGRALPRRARRRGVLAEPVRRA